MYVRVCVRAWSQFDVCVGVCVGGWLAGCVGGWLEQEAKSSCQFHLCDLRGIAVKHDFHLVSPPPPLPFPYPFHVDIVLLLFLVLYLYAILGRTLFGAVSRM